MQEVIQRLRKAGVKVIENDGIELTYDQEMTSFHLVNYEFKERFQDYLNSHGDLAKKYPEGVKSILGGLGSEDVKQFL